MDRQLASVSALQLREMLQTHEPTSFELRELASACKRHLQDAKKLLLVNPRDLTIKELVELLEESLSLYSSIVGSEDLTTVQPQAPLSDERLSKKGRRSAKKSSRKTHSGTYARESDLSGLDKFSLGQHTAGSSHTVQTFVKSELEALNRVEELGWGYFDNKNEVDAEAQGKSELPRGETRRRKNQTKKNREKESEYRQPEGNPRSSCSTRSSSSSNKAGRDKRDPDCSWSFDHRSSKENGESDAVDNEFLSLWDKSHGGNENKDKFTKHGVFQVCVGRIMPPYSHILENNNVLTQLSLSIRLTHPWLEIKELSSEGSPVANGLTSPSALWIFMQRFAVNSSRDGIQGGGKTRLMRSLFEAGVLEFQIICFSGECFYGVLALSTLPCGSGDAVLPVYLKTSTAEHSLNPAGMLHFAIRADNGVAATDQITWQDSYQRPNCNVSPMDKSIGKSCLSQSTSKTLKQSEMLQNFYNHVQAQLFIQRNHAFEQQGVIQAQQQQAVEHQQLMLAQQQQIEQLQGQCSIMSQQLMAANAVIRELEEKKKRDNFASAAQAAAITSAYEKQIQELKEQHKLDLNEAKQAADACEDEFEAQYCLERKNWEERLRRLEDENIKVRNSLKEQKSEAQRLEFLLTNVRKRLGDEKGASYVLSEELKRVQKNSEQLYNELLNSRDESKEMKRELLSLTWGMEAPPRYTGMGKATVEAPYSKQTDVCNKLSMAEKGSDKHKDTLIQEIKKNERFIRRPLWFNVPSCEESDFLKLLVAPAQQPIPTPVHTKKDLSNPLCGSTATLLILHECYIKILQCDMGRLPWQQEGVLIHTNALTVEWRCFIGRSKSNDFTSVLKDLLMQQETCMSDDVGYPAAFFELAVKLKVGLCHSSIAYSIKNRVMEKGLVELVEQCANASMGCCRGVYFLEGPSRSPPACEITIMTSDNQKIVSTVRLPLPSVVFCMQTNLSLVPFTSIWNALKVQSAAVRIMRIKSEFTPFFNLVRLASVITIGGRFFILPVDGADVGDELSRDIHGVDEQTTLRGAASFVPFSQQGLPKQLMREQPASTLLQQQSNFTGPILCLFQVKVAYTESGSAAIPALLDVRCNNNALRVSVLASLLQLLMPTQDVIGAS